MILYPTETIYALGVNAFAEGELDKLFALKGREANKSVSVLVRDLADVERYGILSPKAKLLATKFLPGSLTLVLKARDEVPRQLLAFDGTLGFRISPDKIAQKVIEDFMLKHMAPLTCTSANLSGLPTLPTVPEILKQFGEKAEQINKIYDDGSRSGTSSTVVKVIDNTIEILREGAISKEELLSV